MAAIQFPNNPNAGDLFIASNGIRYTYDGEKWKTLGTSTVGTEGQFLETPTVLTIDKVIPGNTNTGAVGPMAVGDGITLTVPASSTFRTLLGRSGVSSSVVMPLSGGTFTGPVYFSDDAIIKGNATDGSGALTLNCENNSHGIKIKGPPHSAAASYTLTLPNNTGTSGQVLTTNGSGVSSWSSVLPLTGGTLTGGLIGTTANFTGLVNVTGGIQVTENVTPLTGSGVEIFKSSSTSGQIQAFDRSGSAWMNMILKGQTQQFYTAGSERLRIDSSGRLLVGTSNAVAFGSRQVLAVANGTTGGVLSLYNSTTATANPRISSNPTGSEINNIGIHAASTNGSIIAYTNNDTERLRIDSSGRVGIGSSNPQELLQVGAGFNSVNGTLLISADNGFHNFIRFTNGGGGEAHYPAGIWYQPSGRMELRAASSASASNAAQLVLADDGNVGIGASNPGNTLEIKSTTNADGIRLSNAIGSYYHLIRSNGDGLLFDADAGSTGGSGADIRFNVKGSEKMRINSSGRVGINTFDPLEVLHITGNPHAIIRAQASSYTAVSSLYFGDPGLAYSGYLQYAHNGDYLEIGTAGTERMRIDSSGQILMNCTSQIGGGYIQHLKMNSGTGGIAIQNYGSSNTAIVFRNSANNSTVGAITTSNSTTSYLTSSDYRLKENVIDIADGITRIKQLSPKRFNFIAEPDTTLDGFLAHEAQIVVPEAVTGTKDGEEMQGIDQSKLVPLLTAALQEAIGEIETLKQRLSDAGIA